MSELTHVDEGVRWWGQEMVLVEGVGHDAGDLIDAYNKYADDTIATPYVEVWEGRWGWSNRFKNCSNHGNGWGCDNEGEWHRHFEMGYGPKRSAIEMTTAIQPEALGSPRIIDVSTRAFIERPKEAAK